MPVNVELIFNNCLIFEGKVANGQSEKGVPNANVLIYNRTTGQEERLQSNLEGRFEGCLDLNAEFTVTAEKVGFDRGEIKISTKDLIHNRSIVAELRLHPNSANSFNQPIEEGTVIVLRNIYYDFNKSAIRKGDASELMALAKLMKHYPSMEIELVAHTDSRGESDYNLELSLRRADSAKWFLVNQDIDEQRIKTIGLGETQISNHCQEGVACSEEEHQFNRRTEVRITHIDESVKVENAPGNPKKRKKKN
jgi:outer membrane protein OmpA-like peptidoglycan-associated protein